MSRRSYRADGGGAVRVPAFPLAAGAGPRGDGPAPPSDPGGRGCGPTTPRLPANPTRTGDLHPGPDRVSAGHGLCRAGHGPRRRLSDRADRLRSRSVTSPLSWADVAPGDLGRYGPRLAGASALDVSRAASHADARSGRQEKG